MLLEDLAARQHRDLPDGLVVVVDVAEDVVAHELKKVHVAPVKRGQSLQRKADQRSALQLARGQGSGEGLELGLRAAVGGGWSSSRQTTGLKIRLGVMIHQGVQ